MWVAHLLAVSAIGALGGSLIYIASRRMDKRISPDQKTRIAAFLNGTLPAAAGPFAFYQAVRAMFDSLFTEQPRSLAGLGRLVIAAAFGLTATILVPALKYPSILSHVAGYADTYGDPSLAALPTASKFGLFLLMLATSGTAFSLIPAFLALLKSRLWLQLSERHPTWLNIICAGLCDILGSIIIDVVWAVSVTMLDDQMEQTPASLAQRLSENLSSIEAGIKELLLGVPSTESSDIVSSAFSIATMMSCLWLSLAAATIVIVRLAATSHQLTERARRRLDLDIHPVRALGAVSGALFALTPPVYFLV